MIKLKQLPPTFNNVWRHRVIGKHASVYMTAEGKEFKEYARGEIVKQKQQSRPEDMDKEVILSIHYTFPDNRKRDIDNYLKQTLDCMTGLLYTDDSQVVKLTATKEIEKGKSEMDIFVSFAEKSKDI